MDNKLYLRLMYKRLHDLRTEWHEVCNVLQDLSVELEVSDPEVAELNLRAMRCIIDFKEIACEWMAVLESDGE